MDKIHAFVNCFDICTDNSKFYRTESDSGSTMEDVDGVERESVSREIKLQKVKGQGRTTPRKNWGKRRDIVIYVQCTTA
jgi:hypothetical protein